MHHFSLLAFYLQSMDLSSYERLTTQPEIYGKPLQRTLKGYWKLRLGDYRVVFKVSDGNISIFGIIHRKEVYKLIKKRIGS